MTIRTAQTDGTAACHDPVITLEQVNFSYQHQIVIQNLDFVVKQRDFVGLVGANGAGKTTLMRMIVGLLTPSAGRIDLFGSPIAQFRDWERIGYVPQKNSFNPLFPATVKEVVMSGMYNKRKMFRRIGREDLRKAEDAMQVMRIEDLAGKRIGQLSGGQQQRVFLARALINKPDLLLLDEPTVGIDVETQHNFFQLIRHMHQHHRMTIVMVTHDIEMVEEYIGEEPLLQSGKLKFYVKHSHEVENCEQTDLRHSFV
ncbi:metal ABC transporter ATP-binding protein [Paenibacillus sp. MSJ-34]|uniref:metal ABC transporter ATP-binding protein n=1 Tax=Paenibacillus sp. MSJ-34 TaxID=2841529 RepID=UPI001C106D1B|nr:metal ABC transporter ATP-binding protein [Paenibacillus sp. MSJ-34]MBU5443054.1 metal ABC transporter ATP-binding protein [Paenibacillus sp. MSJ-34]